MFVIATRQCPATWVNQGNDILDIKIFSKNICKWNHLLHPKYNGRIPADVVNGLSWAGIHLIADLFLIFSKALWPLNSLMYVHLYYILKIRKDMRF